MKVLRTSKALFGGLAALAMVVMPMAGVAMAATSTTVVSGTITPTLTISSNGGTSAAPGVNMGTAAPTGATQVVKSADDTVKVITNNGAGYVLKLEMDASSTTTNKLKNTLTTATIAATSAGATLSNNSWGFKAGATGTFDSGFTNWNPVPVNGSPVTLATTSAPSAAAGDDRAVTYGFSVDASVPAGTYQNTVLYTATAN